MLAEAAAPALRLRITPQAMITQPIRSQPIVNSLLRLNPEFFNMTAHSLADKG
jgi:hypothetical protein